MKLPKLFIGSSKESIEIAEAIQTKLQYVVEPNMWTENIFKPSKSSLDSLLIALNNSDFGVFVFTPDDISKIRGKRYSVARDNVIFELGLFLGQLGKERAFIVLPKGQENFHLPTDLIGFTPVTYNPDYQSRVTAVSPGCNMIKDEIISLGFRSRPPKDEDEDIVNTNLRKVLMRIRKLPKTGRPSPRGRTLQSLSSLGEWVSNKDFPKRMTEMLERYKKTELRVICYSFVSGKTIERDIEKFLEKGGKLHVLMLRPKSLGFSEKTILEGFSQVKDKQKLDDWRYFVEETRNTHEKHIQASIGQLNKWQSRYKNRVDFRLYPDTPNFRAFMFGNKAMYVSSYFIDPIAPGHDNPHLFVDGLDRANVNHNLSILQRILSNWFEVKFATGWHP